MEVLHDVELWQSLVDERVLVVSPHTLFVALQPLSHAIRYYEMSLGVDEKIRALQGAQQSLHVMSEQLNALLGKAAKAIEMSQSLVRDIPEAAALKPMVVHSVGHAADATSTLPQ
jgi:DNA anti-recombination protein RmuC